MNLFNIKRIRIGIKLELSNKGYKRKNNKEDCYRCANVENCFMDKVNCADFKLGNSYKLYEIGF